MVLSSLFKLVAPLGAVREYSSVWDSFPQKEMHILAELAWLYEPKALLASYCSNSLCKKELAH